MTILTDRTDHRTDRSPVPLTAAADQLGLTVEAIRSRCRRGTLPCQRLPGGGWVVDLIDQMTGDRPVDHSPDRPETGPDQPLTGRAPDALVALVERQTQQIAELSAAAALWQERARFLGEQLRALEAGTTVSVVDDQVTRDMPQERDPATLRGDQAGVVSGSLLGRLRRLIGREGH